MIDTHHGWNSSLKPLVLGFIFSLISTFAIYRIATYMHLRHDWLIATVVGAGLLQVIFQLIFFFHLGLESKPRWNLPMFLCTVLIVLIVVFGTLWIMKHLNYNLMPTMDH